MNTPHEKILTVVVPTYNMERILRHNLDTLLISPSKMEMLEVLVINDGSTDQSSRIAHSYQQSFPGTFRVIDKSNGNYGSCINTGLAQAKGEFIKILDADDCFDSKGLEELIDRLSALPETLDMILTAFKTTDGEGNVLSETRYPLKENVQLTLNEAKGALLDKNLFMAAITYRTQMLRTMAYRQSEGISYSDIEWVFIPLFHIRYLVWFDMPVYQVYSGRPGQSVSEAVMTKNYGQVVKALKKNLDYYLENRPVLIQNEDYLSEKICNLLDNIYGRYLLHRDLPLEELMTLDNAILSADPSYQKATDGFRIGQTRIRYVRLWRRMGRKDSIHLLFYLNRLVKSLQIR